MEIKKLVKRFGNKTVVNNVNFKINKGKVTSFIGPNGAGKSTVMNIISRLLERDDGEIIFEGKDIKNWKNEDLSKKLAILTQSNNINMKLTIRELVAFGRFPYSKGKINAEDEVFISKAINCMELEEIEDKFIDELSGGQRQRAFIAMIIAQDTEYILLDEPINNLDVYHASNLMKMIRKLCDELSKTVILVMHDINYASFYSDYICVFENGNIEHYGKTEDIINEEILSKVYKIDFKVKEFNDKKLCIYY